MEKNFLYNIVFESTNEIFYFYLFLLLIFIFIFINIDFNYSILLGLLFGSLMIYLIYLYREVNILTNKEKMEKKIDYVSSPNNNLYNYNDINDFLFYLKNFESKNINNYYDIVNNFNNFILLYEDSLKDSSLINVNYDRLKNIKNKIEKLIFEFYYMCDEVQYTKILEKNQISAGLLLDKYINKINEIYKKNIYYNGYNNNKVIIDKYLKLPYNYPL